MTDHYDVFLSYSRNDQDAATNLLGQLEKAGLEAFRDQERIRAGDLWLDRLQEGVEACGSFVLLIGRDGVRRWIGAETQAALNRYFGPQDDARRLPIFPILLDGTPPDALPTFVRLFQGTPWNGTGALPATLLEQIRERAIVASKITFEGCPFVGLEAYRIDQAQLFFGRQKETLDALACFDSRPGSPTVRWLEINGNSGSGKSSLMSAGLLPLVDQGWLWPRTGFEEWKRIGPMMPGERPVAMLAEHLARTFGAEMSDIRKRLDQGDDRALADWLRGRKPDDATAFLLAIDQFEELFTFAEPAERGRFDLLLATALEDAECPLFLITTVRSDFLDRFEDLPRLVPVRNRAARPWTLPPVSGEALREIISGPARLAGLDVSEVQEAMVAQARDEPGALPLVENALHWLWQQRARDGRLSGRLLTDQGGLAGILSGSADDLLSALGPQRDQALELLFQLVKVDREGQRHTRQRMSLTDAVRIAGGGKTGRALLDRLAGRRERGGPGRKGPLRLITIGGEAEPGGTARDEDQWIDLIHETLIRCERLDLLGDPRPGIGLMNGLPEIDWVPIAGGQVTIAIRSDPTEPNSPIERTVTRPVEPFSMARYPVTIAQFQAFLDDCHRDGRWRLPLRFPLDLLDSYPAPRHRSRLTNHAADSVKWYDAAAFCHWLSARLERDIRLPNEFEWQLAATSGDSERTYPWGPEWEPWRANTYESELGRVTAVGCYPGGASADGLLDVAGTLWEWGLNEFDDPDATAFPTERCPRVVRGGSWYCLQVRARCAERLGHDPLDRLGDVGFRVVCSAPI